MPFKWRQVHKHNLHIKGVSFEKPQRNLRSQAICHATLVCFLCTFNYGGVWLWIQRLTTKVPETSCMQSHLWSFRTRGGLISESRLVEKRISDSSLVLVSYCCNNIKILRLIPSKLTRRKKKERIQKWRLRMLFQIKKITAVIFGFRTRSQQR